MTTRRFPPPWTVEEHNDACFIVKDATGRAVAYVYFEEERDRRNWQVGYYSDATWFARGLQVRVFGFGLMACVFLGTFNCTGGGGSGDASLSKPQIQCQAGPDCDAKWARANEWAEKSGLKILSKSDAQIKTKAAPKYDDRTLVVTITRNATSKPGIYEIRFVGGCTSWVSCVPPIAESRAGFAAFVLNRE